MNKIPRIHAFDFIRSIAALWGVPFHAALAYIVGNPEPWLVTDPMPGTELLDFILWLSHRIRMPLFFLMSGFFANLVIQRKGVKYFFDNRLKKILVPLLIAIAIILPISLELFIQPIQQTNFLNTSFRNPFHLKILGQFRIGHLWFLYYLLLFSILTIGLHSKNLFEKLKALILTYQKTSKLIAILVLFLLHTLMDNPLKINIIEQLEINPVSFVYYFYFFTWGYLLHCVDILKSLKALKVRWYILGSLLSIFFTATLIAIKMKGLHSQQDSLINFSINAGTTIYCLFTLILILNLGLRFIKKENRLIHYFSDSSYFIYIVHIPVIVLFQRTAYFWDLPGFIKWLIVSTLSYIMLFLFYHLLIRFTLIGTYLHGKRLR